MGAAHTDHVERPAVLEASAHDTPERAKAASAEDEVMQAGYSERRAVHDDADVAQGQSHSTWGRFPWGPRTMSLLPSGAPAARFQRAGASHRHGGIRGWVIQAGGSRWKRGGTCAGTGSSDHPS